MAAVPNLLSALRLVLAPVLLLLAFKGEASWFLLCLASSLSSDVIDGWVARHYRLTSELGAKLDSWGDLATYSSVAVSAWWLWPEIILQQAWWVVAALVAYVLPTLLGFLKFSRLTSYHTWGAKLSSILMGGAFLLLFVWNIAWLFHVATIVLIIAEIEEIAITLVLREWKTNVATIVHAWRSRASS